MSTKTKNYQAERYFYDTSSSEWNFQGFIAYYLHEYPDKANKDTIFRLMNSKWTKDLKWLLKYAPNLTKQRINKLLANVSTFFVHT